MKRTLTNLLPALALVLACLVGSDGFASETIRYRGDGEPIVLARGNARALGRLGFRYENGFGVPQDYIAAADLYRRAAEQGDTFAQCRLGLSYDKGHGVPQDYVRAHMWFNIAAAAAGASDVAVREAAKWRDLVATRMTPAQIAEGRRLAREWQPTK